MKNESNHSQDYDRKHGTDHNVKDKAALKEKFIDELRKNATAKDAIQSIRIPDKDK